MSYDVSIWCTEPFDDPRVLPTPEKWQAADGGWRYEGRGWLLRVQASAKIWDEDIPDEVVGALPGIAHVVYVCLEPLGAPKAGLTMLGKLTRAVAKVAHGVILDPQQDMVELARGTKRYQPPKRDNEQRFAMLEMSWWLNHGRLLEPMFLDSLVELLETHLPESMPRRYGEHEPPQHVYAKTGREHFVSFLATNLTDFIIWNAQRPVGGWHFSVDSSCGFQPLGQQQQYRCNRVTLSLEAMALTQPGWATGLQRFWRRTSGLLQPFFGDVRTLQGYSGRPSDPMMDAETESHPVSSWWWKGIPPELGHAVVVGAPYLEHWPELSAAADHVGELAFLSNDDWLTSSDVSERVGGVPAAMALPFMPDLAPHELGGMAMRYPDTYPELFPLAEVPRELRERRHATTEDAPPPWWKFWKR